MKGRLKQAYALCLRAYPEPFRRVYGEEMSEVFADRLDETGRRGALALLALATWEAWHTLGAILRARCAPRRRP